MILLFKGFVLGFIFAVTMIAGTVWCAQVTIRHGMRSGLGAALGITLGQAVWIVLAVSSVLLFTMLPLNRELMPMLRTVAAIIFVYMSIKLFRARKAESLRCPAAEGGFDRILMGTLAVSLGMPMRYFGYVAFCVAAGLGYHRLDPERITLVIAGAVTGTALWWIYIVVLARIFGRKVPEPITLRSINKLNPLGGVLYLLIGAMTVAPLLVKT